MSVEKKEANVILVSEDELLMGKLEKYHAGAGPNILTILPLQDLIKMHQEILNDWYDKGYTNTGFRILGPNRRLFYVFSKFLPDISIEAEI